MFCSQPSLDSWAWTGLPEGFGRWKYQPQERQARELFFISFLTEKLAVMCWVSFCLLPGTFEPAAHFQLPMVHAEPGRTRCTDRRSSHCCSSVLSQHDGRGRTCPQPQHQILENPHLNTTQQPWLPRSCCWGNTLINPSLSLRRRMCAFRSQHRNLGSGVATRLHHRGWKTPGSVLNPPPKGSNPSSYPGPSLSYPRPSCVESHPSGSCLL